MFAVVSSNMGSMGAYHKQTKFQIWKPRNQNLEEGNKQHSGAATLEARVLMQQLYRHFIINYKDKGFLWEELCWASDDSSFTEQKKLKTKHHWALTYLGYQRFIPISWDTTREGWTNKYVGSKGRTTKSLSRNWEVSMWKPLTSLLDFLWYWLGSHRNFALKTNKCKST